MKRVRDAVVGFSDLASETRETSVPDTLPPAPGPAGSKDSSKTLSIADDRSLPADAIVPVDMDAKSR